MSDIINQLIIGLQMGSIYAIVALGYTMVYGIIRLINFAHGDFIMVSAFMIFTFAFTWQIPAVVSIVIALIITIVLGVTTEKIAYRPLRNSPSITALITAIAVSLFLENLFQLIYGSSTKMYPNIIESKNFNIGNISINNISILTICIAIIVMIGLTIFIKKTKAGRAMRAVSENKDAAVLMGINVDRIISLTFLIGSLLAGIAGTMYYLQYSSIQPYFGSNLGLYAFIAAVVGGIGVIPGACLGGFLIGLVKVLPSILHIDTAYADIFLFGLLIIVLLFKPNGILGKSVGEKV